jgi:3',5'-cyclic AMP phosphodiesterase CpdA
MIGRVVHISDLHRGKHEQPAVDDALVALVDEIAPELVVVTGDLANRGRRPLLERARLLLDRLPAPALAVPGNHDLPYRFPQRFTSPGRLFAEVIGPTQPAYRSETLVVCGLDSTRPWRHQGGALRSSDLRRAAEQLAAAPVGALRVVAFHHHLAGAPWRAARKLPLADRDRVLSALAIAGADVILGGHIHQATAVSNTEFTASPPSHPVVLATAPGLGRPRPSRRGEAQGLQVVSWSADVLHVETYTLVELPPNRFASFMCTGRRLFKRGDMPSIVRPSTVDSSSAFRDTGDCA